VIGILNSVLGLGVYLRIVVPMYGTAPEGGPDLRRAHPALITAGAVAAAVTLVMGLFAGILPG
jgi:NADH:ubiquinone oxidoreductase subunit 2 (subunit N)